MSRNIEPIVLGICGASCSGKTTAAATLHRLFQCKNPVVCLDIYATNPLPVTCFEREDGRTDTWLNWESLETINVESFVVAVKNAVVAATQHGDKLVIVEGFLIFAG